MYDVIIAESMWRGVGWLVPARLGLLEPLVATAKPNLAAKPSQMDGFRLVCTYSGIFEPVLMISKPILAAKPNQMGKSCILIISKPNLAAKPNLRPFFTTSWLAAKPKKKKKDDKTEEDEKIYRNKHSTTSKYIKLKKVTSVDVWDSMSLADLGS
jgi:hypothetical protein